MYGAIRPDTSEYFLAGRNDGGAFSDESKKSEQQMDNQGNSMKGNIMVLQVTASSGHCSARSVAKICFNDFHMRFLPVAESANVDFLKMGAVFVSVILS